MDTAEAFHYIHTINLALQIMLVDDIPADEGARKEWADQAYRLTQAVGMLSINRDFAIAKYKRVIDAAFEEARTIIYMASKSKKNGLNLRNQ